MNIILFLLCFLSTLATYLVKVLHFGDIPIMTIYNDFPSYGSTDKLYFELLLLLFTISLFLWTTYIFD